MDLSVRVWVDVWALYIQMIVIKLSDVRMIDAMRPFFALLLLVTFVQGLRRPRIFRQAKVKCLPLENKIIICENYLRFSILSKTYDLSFTGPVLKD